MFSVSATTLPIKQSWFSLTFNNIWNCFLEILRITF